MKNCRPGLTHISLSFSLELIENKFEPLIPTPLQAVASPSPLSNCN